MLVAIDGGKARWWVLYAASSCAAMYSHYTAVFFLAAQLAWLLVGPSGGTAGGGAGERRGGDRLPPWLTGLIADLNSPTTKLLGLLEPFTLATSGSASSTGRSGIRTSSWAWIGARSRGTRADRRRRCARGRRRGAFEEAFDSCYAGPLPTEA